MRELHGATVLVTGAGNGIGRALAEGFLGDGARVVAADVDEAALQSLADRGAVAMTADVAEPDAVGRMVDACLATGGRLDVLVNNAGIAVDKAIDDHGPDEFERVLRVNLFAPFYTLRAALPVMRGQGFGRVINLMSRHAEFAPAGLAGYSASKAALWALTRTTARETEGLDILVNALIPGPTRTNMNPRGTQAPDAVYPTAQMLATLPPGGPSGKCFWDMAEYRMYQPDRRVAQ